MEHCIINLPVYINMFCCVPMSQLFSEDPYDEETPPLWDTFAVALRCPLIRGFTEVVNQLCNNYDPVRQLNFEGKKNIFSNSCIGYFLTLHLSLF